MRARAALFALLLAASGPPAGAHPAPNSLLRLDFRAHSVAAELLVPVSELAHANGSPSRETLAAYLLRHIGAETPAGALWKVEVTDVQATTYLEHDYFRAAMKLVPPPGASPEHFILVTDLVTHEVRNHVVFVVADEELLGALQFPARRLDVQRPVSARLHRPESVPGA